MFIYWHTALAAKIVSFSRLYIDSNPLDLNANRDVREEEVRWNSFVLRIEHSLLIVRVLSYRRTGPGLPN